MGQCTSKSPEDLQQMRKNKALELELAKAQEKEDSKIKLLLLGTIIFLLKLVSRTAIDVWRTGASLFRRRWVREKYLFQTDRHAIRQTMDTWPALKLPSHHSCEHYSSETSINTWSPMQRCDAYHVVLCGLGNENHYWGWCLRTWAGLRWTNAIESGVFRLVW